MTCPVDGHRLTASSNRYGKVGHHVGRTAFDTDFLDIRDASPDTSAASWQSRPTYRISDHPPHLRRMGAAAFF
jgi:hypothetical protein